MGNQCSYSIRKVTEWLTAKDLAFNFNSPNLSSGMPEMTQTGIVFKVNDAMRLSVQTHPIVTGTAFAETALQNDKGVVYCPELGYDEVIRHAEPEELFEHITKLLELLKEKPADFGADFEPNKRKSKKKSNACHAECHDDVCNAGSDHGDDVNETHSDEDGDGDNGDDDGNGDIDFGTLGNDPSAMLRTLTGLFRNKVLGVIPQHETVDQSTDLQNETTDSKIESFDESADTLHET